MKVGSAARLLNKLQDRAYLDNTIIKMNDSAYSRVLIVGQSFDRRKGGGITMINLFKGWPKEKLAVASTSIDLSTGDICDNYYQLGTSEIGWRFPFGLGQRKIASGPLPASRLTAGEIPNRAPQQTRPVQQKWRENLKDRIYRLLHEMGWYHQYHHYRLSEAFLNWVKAFEPEVIYTHATSRINIKMVTELVDIVDAKLAVHIMDDYFSTMNKAKRRQAFWQNDLEETIAELLEKTDVAMSISQEMAREYEGRYGVEFIPFHNPVKLDHWQRAARKSWEKPEVFTVMYAGRLGRGTSISVLEVARTVSDMALSGLDVRFKVHTNTPHSPLIDQINALPHCSVLPPCPYAEVPHKLASADLLVLPMDFDAENLRYIRLSMPTKASEYMASGVPILVYAPESTAMAKYAQAYNWAMTVTKQHTEEIRRAILQLYENEALRREIAENGMQVARERHEAEVVREAFRSLLLAPEEAGII